MLKWFRGGPPPHQTALAMIGAKPGDRVLFVGRPDPPLAGAVAAITGLNGQTLAATQPDQRARFETAAAEAGALIDVADLAADDTSFVPHGLTELDVVVLTTDLARLETNARITLARDAMQVLRPGGRLIVIDGQKKTLLRSAPPTMPADVVVPLLTSVGAQAARALGVAEGVTYYEARKSR